MYALYFGYAVFGFTFAFISVAVQYSMSDTYHFTPGENAYAWSLISLPWVFKPLYAVVSDYYPLFGYRRSYISAAAFMCGVTFAYAPAVIAGKTSLVMILMLCSFCLCVADVGCDSMMVEFVRSESVKGQIQSHCWLARTIGSLAATGLAGATYEQWGVDVVMRIAAAPPFTLALVIWNVKESARVTQSTLRDVLCNAGSGFFSMWRLVLLIALCSIIPELSTLLFFKLRAEDIGPIGFSLIGLSAAVCSVVVTFLYQFWKGERSSIVASLVFSSVSTLCAFAISVGAPAFNFAVARSVCNSISGILFIMPVVIYTARHCPAGSEGTTYSMVMSWINLTGILSETVEGGIANAMGISASHLAPLALFCWVAVFISCMPCCFIPQFQFLNSKDSNEPKPELSSRA